MYLTLAIRYFDIAAYIETCYSFILLWNLIYIYGS